MKHAIARGKKGTLLYRVFRISLVIKGIDGALELIGGTLFLFVKPDTIGTVVGFLTRRELAEDPKDFLANLLVHAAKQLSVSTEIIAGIYLLAHGVIKVGLVIGLWKDVRWIYPIALVFLGVFILLELGRLFEIFSIGIFVALLFDLFILTMVWFEFQKSKKLQ